MNLKVWLTQGSEKDNLVNFSGGGKVTDYQWTVFIYVCIAIGILGSLAFLLFLWIDSLERKLNASTPTSDL